MRDETFTVGDTDVEVKVLGPDKAALDILKLVLAQNEMVLKQNAEIVRSFANPYFAVKPCSRQGAESAKEGK